EDAGRRARRRSEHSAEGRSPRRDERCLAAVRQTEALHRHPEANLNGDRPHFSHLAMSLKLPKSRAEIKRIQAERKRHAVEQAMRSPFWRPQLEKLRLERLEDPDEWRRIPILDKDTLRALSDERFYNEFCVKPADGIQV